MLPSASRILSGHTRLLPRGGEALINGAARQAFDSGAEFRIRRPAAGSNLQRSPISCAHTAASTTNGCSIRRRTAPGRPDNGATASCAFLTNREVLTPRGIIADTFETSITWTQRFPDFHARVKAETERAIEEVTGRKGVVTCRFTHVYPDGPAPYFSFHALGDKRRLVEQCWAIKIAASEVLNALGGTITHHHAVGRDHRRWYDKQRPDLFAGALRAAKKSLDPRGMLNPGVLVDPLA